MVHFINAHGNGLPVVNKSSFLLLDLGFCIQKGSILNCWYDGLNESFIFILCASTFFGLAKQCFFFTA